MRIGIFTTLEQIGWGGSELLWTQTATAALQCGYAISINVSQAGSQREQIKQLAAAGCSVYARHPRKTTRSLSGKERMRIALTGEMQVPAFGESDLEDWGRITAWLDSAKPNVVLISQSFLTDGFNVRQACIDRGIPFVTLIQSASDPVWPASDLLEAFARQFEAAAACVFVSSKMLGFARSRFGAKLPNAAVVYNPVNLKTREQNISWPGNAAPLILASVGRLECVQKGQDLLLEALAAPHRAGRAVEVHLYGDGPDRAYLERLVQYHGLDNVRFCGFVNDVAEIWRKSHALVLPSRYEGLPLAVAEAMLCARPCVVTDVMGNAELIEDGATGFVAPAPTAAQIGEALDRAWQERDNLQVMGQHAREEALARLPINPAQDLLSLIANAYKCGHSQ